MSREALKLALEALEASDDTSDATLDAMHALREALAQEQGLFVDLIAKHKGLAEELAKMDLEPQPEQELEFVTQAMPKHNITLFVDGMYLAVPKEKQDAETNLQAVADFGQLQALSEPSECWDCFCLQENAQDNDVICDPCRWAKESLVQPDERDRCTHGVWIADHCYECAASQPEQEPVAWRNAAIRVGEDLCSVGPFGYYDMTAEQWLDWALSVVTVHASPPQRQPLTDEEIVQIELSLRQYNSRDTYDLSLNEFARAIEAAHGIGDKT